MANCKVVCDLFTAWSIVNSHFMLEDKNQILALLEFEAKLVGDSISQHVPRLPNIKPFLDDLKALLTPKVKFALYPIQDSQTTIFLGLSSMVLCLGSSPRHRPKAVFLSTPNVKHIPCLDCNFFNKDIFPSSICKIRPFTLWPEVT